MLFSCLSSPNALKRKNLFVHVTEIWHKGNQVLRCIYSYKKGFLKINKMTWLQRMLEPVRQIGPIVVAVFFFS